MSTPFLSIVMPAYNEEENLSRFVPVVIEKIAPLVAGLELLIVDDGSTDKTAEISDTLARRFSEIRVVKHPANRGPGSGLYTGIAEAKGEWVIFIPADIAIDLDTFSRYVNAAKNADLVVGIRSDRRDYTLVRKFTSVVYIALIKTLFRMPQRQFNFVHMYRRGIFKTCLPTTQSVFITAEIMIRARDAGLRLVEVDVPYIPRAYGVATCGKPAVIDRTFRDMLGFWWSWIRGKIKAPPP